MQSQTAGRKALQQESCLIPLNLRLLKQPWQLLELDWHDRILELQVSHTFNQSCLSSGLSASKHGKHCTKSSLPWENTRPHASLRYFHSGLPQQGLSLRVTQCCPQRSLSCTHGSQLDFPPCVGGCTTGKAGRVYGSQVGALNRRRGILDEKSSPWRKKKHPNRDSHHIISIIPYVT